MSCHTIAGVLSRSRCPRLPTSTRTTDVLLCSLVSWLSLCTYVSSVSPCLLDSPDTQFPYYAVNTRNLAKYASTVFGFYSSNQV